VTVPTPVSDLPEGADDVRRHDRDRFLATLWAPAGARDLLMALLAFNLDIARLRETVSQPMLGRIRLQWWREALDEAYGGTTPRRHPILLGLLPAIRDGRLDRADFETMIDAREADWDEAPPADLPALLRYAEATSGMLAVTRLAVLGAATEADRVAGMDLGAAWALAGLIRAIPFHARTQRLLIPETLVRESGLDPESFFAGKASPALCRAVAVLAETARDRLKATRSRREQVSAAALPVMAEARLVAFQLARIAKARHDPFAPGLAEPDSLAAWRLGFARLTRRY
jgi:NADH dehydrogenase [ubiquinone] 1 alpha subcomplex assembly factor 6